MEMKFNDSDFKQRYLKWMGTIIIWFKIDLRLKCIFGVCSNDISLSLPASHYLSIHSFNCHVCALRVCVCVKYQHSELPIHKIILFLSWNLSLYVYLYVFISMFIFNVLNDGKRRIYFHTHLCRCQFVYNNGFLSVIWSEVKKLQ